ncbi:MAG: flavodoxin domain-containing protein [Candidatus Hodarchaeota archaeon]
MKKALILYDSVYGNTKKVAMSLSRGLEAGGIYVDSSSIQDFDTIELKNYDIIGIGGPTHFHGASKAIKSFLSKIRHLKMENKQGFAFETKADFRLAGSAAKRIIKYLRKMKIEIIHSVISGLVVDKEGPLQENSLNKMEKIGLNIAEKLNNDIREQSHENKNEMPRTENILLRWNRLQWLLLGGGPLFFFIRAITLISAGGDCLIALNPFISWFMLLLELVISGITGIVNLIIWIKGPHLSRAFKLRRLFSRKVVYSSVVTTYIIHLFRASLYILICVI